MEFNGAVLVCNEKIQVACDNYKVKDEFFTKEYGKGKQLAADSVESWGWWGRFWNGKDSNLSSWKYRYHFSWRGLYKSLYFYQYISKEVHDWYDNSTCLGYDDMCYNLSQMIKCGDPVYLNPQQASFVNKFFKERVL